MRKKIFSAFLVLAMVMSLMPIGAFAAESSFTDMPSDYSTAALQAAVTNGILKGTDGKILPDDNLTRAQLAAVVVRAFGATTSASLTTFTDVEADAWYYAELSKAVGMGVIQGSGSVIDPNGFVTREQTAAILARALKLADGTAADLASFTDAASVDSWAVGTMAAMVKAGYIHGADGRLNPTAYITRKDFAVMMNNIVSEYIAKAGTYDTVASGSVLVNTAGVTLKGVTVSGNLIVGDGVGDGDMTLDGVTVKGAVIVRGGGVNSLHIKGDSNISTVVVAKVDGNVRVAVEGAAKVAVVAVADGKNDVVIEGKVDTVSVQTADTPVVVQNAEVKTVEVKAEKAAVTVAETAKVETVSAEAPNANVTVAGTVTTVKATEEAKGTAVTVEKTATVTTVSTEASGTKLDVAGKVTTVTASANAADTKVDVAAGATVTTVNAAASGTQISGSGTVTNANVTGNNVKVDTNGTKTTVDKSATGTTSGGKDVAGGSSTTTNTGSSTSGGSSSGGGSTAPVDTTVYVDGTNKTLQSAIDAAGTAETVIKLTGNITEDITVPSGRKIALNLNGFTITNNSSDTITNNGSIKITGTGTVDNVSDKKSAIMNNYGGDMVIDGGTYTRSKENSTENSNTWYIIRNKGNMQINGGTVASTSTWSSAVINGWSSSAFDGDIPKADEKKAANLRIDGGSFRGGKHVVKNGDFGVLLINNGTFTNNTAATSGGSSTVIYNCGVAAIFGGTFTATDPCKNVLLLADNSQTEIDRYTATFSGTLATKNTSPSGVALFYRVSNETQLTEYLKSEDEKGNALVEGNISLTTNMVIPQGKFVFVSHGKTFTVSSGKTLTLNGELATVDYNGNAATEAEKEGGIINILGTVDIGTTGQLVGGDNAADSSIIVNNGGKLIIDSDALNGTQGNSFYALITNGYLDVYAGGEIHDKRTGSNTTGEGVIIYYKGAKGYLTDADDLYIGNDSAARINLTSGSIYLTANAMKLSEKSTATVNKPLYFSKAQTVTLDNDSNLTVAEGGSITNDGALVINGTLATTSGTLTGTLTGNGTIIVNTADQLSAVLASGFTGTVKLGDDLTVGAPVAITKNITLDGNGKTLTAAANFPAVTDTNGVLTIAANATVNDLTIDGNSVARGIYAQGDTAKVSVVLNNIKIQNCKAQSLAQTSRRHTYNAGAGIRATHSNLDITLTGCTIKNNTALGSGGAISFDNVAGKLSLTDCTITDNVGGYYAGGIWTASTAGIKVLLTGNTITGNTLNRDFDTAATTGYTYGCDQSGQDLFINSNSAGSGSCEIAGGTIGYIHVEGDHNGSTLTVSGAATITNAHGNSTLSQLVITPDGINATFGNVAEPHKLAAGNYTWNTDSGAWVTTQGSGTGSGASNP